MYVFKPDIGSIPDVLCFLFLENVLQNTLKCTNFKSFKVIQTLHANTLGLLSTWSTLVHAKVVRLQNLVKFRVMHFILEWHGTDMVSGQWRPC